MTPKVSVVTTVQNGDELPCLPTRRSGGCSRPDILTW
jgi:hypothetical protein